MYCSMHPRGFPLPPAMPFYFQRGLFEGSRSLKTSQGMEYVERTVLLNAEKENWRSRYEALQLGVWGKREENSPLSMTPTCQIAIGYGCWCFFAK